MHSPHAAQEIPNPYILEDTGESITFKPKAERQLLRRVLYFLCFCLLICMVSLLSQLRTRHTVDGFTIFGCLSLVTVMGRLYGLTRLQEVFVIHLRDRTYVWKHGTAVQSGALSQITGIYRVARSYRNTTDYLIIAHLPKEQFTEPLIIGNAQKEADAQSQCAQLAARLQVPVIVEP